MPLKRNKALGKFIVFEGMDGVGKTTLVDLTYEFLKSQNVSVVKTFTPTNEIRNLPYWQEYADATTNRSDFDPFGLDMIAFAIPKERGLSTCEYMLLEKC